MNGPVRRYLRLATRGVYGRQRRAIQDELRGHIEARTAELLLGGLGELEATREALRELGAPASIAGGMAQVYSLPPVLRGAVGLALAATALLSLAPHGLAQVRSILVPRDLTGLATYLDLQQVQAEVHKAGGQLNNQHGVLTLRLPGMTNHLEDVSATWADPVILRNGHVYVDVNLLVSGVQADNVDVRVSGWSNPALRIGPLTIPVQTAGDPQVPTDLYAATLRRSDLTDQFQPFLNVLPQVTTSLSATFAGAFPAEQPYALLTPAVEHQTVDPGMLGGNVTMTVDIGVPEAAGHLILRRDNNVSAIRLLSSMDAFRIALLAELHTASTSPSWTRGHPAPALLLKLNGRLGPQAYTVIPADQVHVLAQ